MQSLHVPAGATIFRAGDPSQGVFIIEEGEVAITVGNNIEVARLQSGELFGESGVLESRSRSATATALVATTLLVTPTETFVHAFGMDNDRALALVKMLCRRLRKTNLRSVPQVQAYTVPAPIRLTPDSEQLATLYHMEPIDVRHLPFQVGNRYGGETLPMASNHSCCILARGDTNLAAPHFEILRRDGCIGIRDLGTATGTIVNGTSITRSSLNAIVPLRSGNNVVIAGRPDSPFRFRLAVNQSQAAAQ